MAPDQELPEREQHVADLLAQARAGTRAPDSLRARVDAMQPGHDPRRRLGPIPRASAALGVLTMSVAALVAVVAVLLINGGSTAAPTLAQVAALSGRGPAGPAPGPDRSQPAALLSAAVGDLRFPNWRSRGGWRASGERADTVSGRRVVTVYYTRGGTRLAYSIAASPALAGSRSGHERYVVVRRGARVAVAWTERNHTCVLSGAGISAEALWRLAATTLD